MAGSFSDRNLLFGVLALQLELITRDELIAAAHVWTLNKSRSLGEILVEQKRLQAPDRQALERLVGKVTESPHAKNAIPELGDGPATLEPAANGLPLPAPPIPAPHVSRAARATFDAPQPEPSLRAGAAPQHVAPLSQRDQATQNYQAEPAPDPNDALATRMIGEAEPQGSPDRYHIVRLHRSGGLAEVYLAVDEELRREVALKQIKPVHADELSSRERFVNEAEITGSLEHPAIVPVYSLGQYPDGRPYYAMRFIEGQTLQEAIERFHEANESQGRSEGSRGLELRKLLSRFITVCEAVEYAHSQGIIHRDLKPSNIMLGDFGETLVVDWGLAKRLDQAEPTRHSHSRIVTMTGSSSSGHTRLGNVVGTPQYMSPEQAQGRNDKLGPATDIYSLGAVLFTLLVGKSPFDGRDSVERMIEDVRRGHFKRPRELNRAVSTALEAIVLKAMAQAPEDRYTSAEALADDVEHWLADEPILALPESFWVRAGRKVRRHRGVALATTMLLAAVAISGGLMWNQRTHAQAVRDEAEIAMKTVNRVFDNVSTDELLDEPSLQSIRITLLEYYKHHAGLVGDDSTLLQEYADAQMRMAKIARATETKNEAFDYYAKAQKVYERMLRAAPDDAARKRDLANIAIQQGNVMYELGEYSQAEEQLTKARDELKRLSDERPSDLSLKSLLAEAWHNLGIVLSNTEQSTTQQRIIEAYENGRKLRQQLYNLNRDSRENVLALAASWGYIGDYYLDANQWNKAQQAYLDSKLLRADVVERNKDDLEAKFQLARAERNMAFLHCRSHRQDQEAVQNFALAKEHFQKAIALQLTLREQKPANRWYGDDLGYTYAMYGSLCIDTGDLTEGLDASRKAFEIYNRLVQGDAEVPDFRRGRARSAINLAKCDLALAKDQPDTPAGNVDAHLEQARKHLATAEADLTQNSASNSTKRSAGEGEELYLLAQAKAMRAELSADSETLLKEAALLLQRASRQRFADLDLLARDRAFKMLRSSASFNDLVNYIKSSSAAAN
ncbi:MAG: serine/threonine protein kinase [Planctomycetes bacterium]|nr:serine/threonine protein kinase [Planctomycetota bacterium]